MQTNDEAEYQETNMPMEVVDELNEMETNHYDCRSENDSLGADEIMIRLKKCLKLLRSHGWNLGKFEFYLRPKAFEG